MLDLGGQPDVLVLADPDIFPQLLEALLSPAGFVRVHRSVLVNIRHVVKLTSIDDGRVAMTLSSGARVVASKARAPELRQRLRI